MAKKRVKKTMQQTVKLRLASKASYAIPNPAREAEKKACRGKVRIYEERD